MLTLVTDLVTITGEEWDIVITVVGIGDCGRNAVAWLHDEGIQRVQLIIADHDPQLVRNRSASTIAPMGSLRAQGFDRVYSAERGRQSTLKQAEAIRHALRGSHVVLIAAGTADDNGVVDAILVGSIAVALGAFTVAVVTDRFTFEGEERGAHGQDEIRVLRESVDALIVIPDERSSARAEIVVAQHEAFAMGAAAVGQTILAITDALTGPGDCLSADLADIRWVLQGKRAIGMGAGMASGEHRGRMAAQRALSSPMLKDVPICRATSVFVNMTGGSDTSLRDVDEVRDTVSDEAGEDVDLVLAGINRPQPTDVIRVTLIAAR